MGIAGRYTPEKLVMCVLSSSPGSAGELRDLLVEQWGDIDFSSEPIPFTATDYYDREMGRASCGHFFLSGGSSTRQAFRG